jgi:hypothetical protein
MKPTTELPGGEAMVYKSPDGQVRVDVRIERETVWLTQEQMAVLFGKSFDTIGLHIRDVFKEKELYASATTGDASVVQTEGGRRIAKRVKLYNLDVILSVAYRVNAKRGMQFRVWATRALRERLSHATTFNERRLREKGLAEMEVAAALVTRALARDELSADEGQAVLDSVQRYARAWCWLFAYDERRPARVTSPHREPT